MRNQYEDNHFEHLIKQTLNCAAEEIQENPYEKNKVMSLIKEKESSKMRNKKFSKKIVVGLALVICLSAGTAMAAGGALDGWVSHSSLSDPTYTSVADIMDNKDDFDFSTPYAVDEFSNGYKFDSAYLDQFDGRDAENNTICTVKGLNVEYLNADGQKVELINEKMPEAVVINDNTVYEGETTYKDVNIKYNVDPYMCVGGDYEPTAEEQAKVDAGELYISCDSSDYHEPEYYKTVSVSWTIDGVDYRIWGFDYETDLTEDQLYQMAQEVIDLQIAE